MEVELKFERDLFCNTSKEELEYLDWKLNRDDQEKVKGRLRSLHERIALKWNFFNEAICEHVLFDIDDLDFKLGCEVADLHRLNVFQLEVPKLIPSIVRPR